jgi:hypothetical protein
VTQTPLFVILHVIGVCLCLAFGPRRRPWWCCALGFPIGLASVVVLLLPLQLAGLPFAATACGVAGGLVVLAVATLARRGWPPAAVWRKVALWTAGFAAVCLPLTAVNLSLLYWDGHLLVMLGQVIVGDDGLSTSALVALADIGVFQPIAHAGVRFTGESYLYSLSAVLGLSAIPLFAITLSHGLAAVGVRRPGLVALVTAALFSTYMLQLHFFYLHANLTAAVFLFVFVTILWLAEVEGDAAALPIAWVAITAFALSRVETPAVAVLFLAITILPSRLPGPARFALLAMHAALLAGWYLLLARHVPAEGGFLTSSRCYAVVSVYGALVIWAVVALLGRAGWIERINRLVPAVALAVGLLLLAAAFATRPAHMGTSLGYLLANLFASRWWMACWWIVAVLVIAAWRLPRPPAATPFAIGIPLYVIAILLFAYGRVPYRYNLSDSASRMMLHLAPLVFFYLAVKLAPAMARYRDSGRMISGAPPSPIVAST